MFAIGIYLNGCMSFDDHLYRWRLYLIEFRDKNSKETVGFYLEAFELVCEAHILKTRPYLSPPTLILKNLSSVRCFTTNRYLWNKRKFPGLSMENASQSDLKTQKMALSGVTIPPPPPPRTCAPLALALLENGDIFFWIRARGD